RRGEDLQDRRPIIRGLPRKSEVLTREGRGWLERSCVLRAAGIEGEVHFEDDGPLVADPTHLLRNHATDDRGGYVVQIKDSQDASHVLRQDREHHPLLALGDPDLPWRESLLLKTHLLQIDLGSVA